jgi:hypothetical protein
VIHHGFGVQGSGPSGDLGTIWRNRFINGKYPRL